MRTQVGKWDEFVRRTEGPGPLGINHEAVPLSNVDYAAHNVTMTFGYALALAARQKDSISILDWGSGVGHYYRLAKALLPGVQIDYFAHDLPSLCAAGRALQPDVQFSSDPAEWRRRQYDLVLASGSLEYVENWRGLLSEFAKVTRGLALITRLGIVKELPSFFGSEVPSELGYEAPLTAWVLNRREFLDAAKAEGLALVREFVLHPLPAPDLAEQPEMRGYLFHRESPPEPDSIDGRRRSRTARLTTDRALG